MDVESLKKIMKKCDIYFEDRLISGELLLRSFMEFLTNEASKTENNGSIVLHLAYRVLTQSRLHGRLWPS